MNNESERRYIALSNKALRYGWHLLSVSEQRELSELHGEWLEAQVKNQQPNEGMIIEPPFPRDQ